MRFVGSLLSIVAALTAVGSFFLGTMRVFTDDPHNPVVAWGYALVACAILMILLGVMAAVLLWIKPGFAEKAMWLGAAAGVAAMGVEGVVVFIARSYPNAPDAQTAITSVLLSGAVPAVAAASAALLTRHLILPNRSARPA
jgi:hypothetical protein